MIGDAETVAQKILHVNYALGGISRITFQMGVSTLSHRKMLRAIEILGTRVVPIVHRELAAALRVPDATLVAPSTPAHQAGVLPRAIGFRPTTPSKSIITGFLTPTGYGVAIFTLDL